MASRKTGAGRKPRNKKSGSGGEPRTGFSRSVFGVSILAAIVLVLGFATRALLPPSPGPRATDAVGHKQTSSKKNKTSPQPQFEIFPDEEPHPDALQVNGTPEINTTGIPKAALIIDDIGYDRHLARKLMDLGIPLTFSILPVSPFGEEIAREARKRGVEIMLHQPMEPLEYPDINPGPGALLTSMTPDELIDRLEKNLDAAPFAVGVNNHMGSRLTMDADRMNQVFTILKKRNLFFIDSRTSPDSVCRSSARLLRIPFAERDVFIDHDHSAEAVARQLRRLVSVAVRRGTAVGIAHPHALTHDALKAMLPEIKQTVEFVPASVLVREMNVIAAEHLRHAAAGAARNEIEP